MLYSDQTIRGKIVIAGDGQVVGEIQSLCFDSVSWKVESFTIRLRKDTADQLGAHRSVFQAGEFELPIVLIQSVGETVILSVGVQELRKVLPSEANSAAPV